MAIDDNASYELTGYQVKDLAQKIRAKADSSSLASVATSGLYSDLTGAPTIPTVYNGKLTITVNGTNAGEFTANQSTDTTIALTDTTYSDFVGSTISAAGAAGLVPAPTTSDPDKFLKGDGTWAEPSAKLVEMSYGESNAWAKFIAAYNAGSIVYCRASSNANPATGSQTRKAFMAYVNNAASPTSVEFQYVRSVSSKSDSQQCDQVFVYTLTSSSGGTWSVASRDMATKVNVNSTLTKTYSGGANASMTLGAKSMTGATSSTAGAAGIVPAPAAGDEGKFLAGDGTWKTAGGGGGNTVTYIATDLLQMVYTAAMQDAQTKGIGNILSNLMFPNTGFVFLKEDGSEMVPASEICEKFGQGYDVKLKCMFQQYGGMNVQPGYEKVNGSIIAADPYSITNLPMTMSFMHDNATNLGSGGTFVVRVQQTAPGSDSKMYGTFVKL